MLNGSIGPFTSNQTLSIEDGVFWIGCQLILSGVTNKTFSLSGESNIRWSDTVTLVIWNDFNTAILVNTDAEIRDMVSFLDFVGFGALKMKLWSF